MKRLFYLLIITLLSCLAGCSDKDLLTGNKADINRPSDESGPFIAIHVASVGDIGSREIENFKDPVLDDGGNQEWAVHDGKIIIFSLPKGTPLSADKSTYYDEEYDFVIEESSENMAQFAGCLDLTIEGNDKNSDAYITSDVRAYATIDIESYDIENKDYYAVIVLNVPDDFPLGARNQTFGEWKENTCSTMWIDADDTYYITMSNAPQWQPGGDPITLQPIDLTKTGYDPTSLQSAGSFYVQRGACKVTVLAHNLWNQANLAYINDDPESPYYLDIVTFYGFSVDNIVTETFPVQYTEGLSTDFPEIWNTQRFYDPSNGFHRVFWGKDPSYYPLQNGRYGKFERFHHIFGHQINDDGDDLPGCRGTSGNIIMLENTMDTSSMIQEYTTFLLHRGVYIPLKLFLGNYEDYEDYDSYLRESGMINDLAFKDGEVYKAGAETRTISYEQDKARFNSDKTAWRIEKTKDYAATLQYRGGYPELTKYSFLQLQDGSKRWLTNQFENVIIDLYNQFSTGSDQMQEDYENNAGGIVEDEWNTDLEPGEIFGAEVESGIFSLRSLLPGKVINKADNNADFSNALIAAIGVESMDSPQLVFYNKSIMYYTMPIRHFNDSETPWDRTEPTLGENRAKYLGRYGVVRNTWYYFDIKGFRAPGSPTIPDIPYLPDDEYDPKLIIDVKILPWISHDITIDNW